MAPMTAKDVAFTLMQIGQAAEAAVTLYPHSTTAYLAQRDTTALLQLWEVQESGAAIDEILSRLEQSMTQVLGQASPSQVWRLLARKIEVAQAFLKTYRAQQAEIAARQKLIDDEAGN